MAVLSNWIVQARRLDTSRDVQVVVGLYHEALVRREESASFADPELHNALGEPYLAGERAPQAARACECEAERIWSQQPHANPVALCKKILRNAPERLPAGPRAAGSSSRSGLEVWVENAFAKAPDC